MKRESKKLYNSKLLILGIISLIIIFVVVLIGTLSGRYSFWLKKWNGSIVLGISDKLPIVKTSENVEKLLEEAVSSTKEGGAKKGIEGQERGK